MSNSTLIGLALVKSNWDEQRHDYVENYVRLVAECIRESEDIGDNNVISTPIIQSKLKDRFGLDLPHHAIDMILGRAKKRGYIQKSHSVYVPVWSKLETLDFSKLEDKMLGMHDNLIDALVQFCDEHYSIRWTKDQAEAAFHAYLDDMQVTIVTEQGLGTVVPQTNAEPGSHGFLVGVFVKHLVDSGSQLFSFLETIIQGSMLANAVLLPDVQAQRKFRNTEVYFDTRFLINTLGYAGEPRKGPAFELIQLAASYGATLRCFRHTLFEIQRALRATAQLMAHPHDAYGPVRETIEFFRGHQLESSDVLLRAETAEKDLRALGIAVVDKPAYPVERYPFVIDEQQLGHFLTQQIPYRSVSTALDCDVASIAAIMRLRAGRESTYVEECRAVFVTTNAQLVSATREFLNGERVTYEIAPCLTDASLTNVLWLKDPGKSDLPRKRIIADAYAAVQPSDALWQRFISELQKLQREHRISIDDWQLLVYSTTVKPILMDVTLGDESAFTQDKIPRIVERLHADIRAEDRRQLEEGEKQREELNRRLLEKERREQERREAATRRAKGWAHRIAGAIRTALLLVLFVGTIVSFPWKLPEFGQNWLRYTLFLAALVALLFVLWKLRQDSQVTTSKIEDYLAQRIEGILTSWADLND